MNADIKTRWTTALRSGEYPQTKGTLHRLVENDGRPAGYCCLGVLCELAIADGVIVRYPHALGMLAGAYMSTNRYGERIAETALLPAEVMAWAGLDTAYGLEVGVPGDATLASLNDEGLPFAEIADVIERDL